VSFDYYARLERGNLAGVSEPVLESLARAFNPGPCNKGPQPVPSQGASVRNRHPDRHDRRPGLRA
jgi:hypothetical protein